MYYGKINDKQMVYLICDTKSYELISKLIFCV